MKVIVENKNGNGEFEVWAQFDTIEQYQEAFAFAGMDPGSRAMLHNQDGTVQLLDRYDADVLGLKK